MNRDSSEPAIPDGLELARTTPEFDEHTVPPGLLKAHQVAAGVWGRLVVSRGRLDFTFEDQADERRSVGPGESVVIPPQRPHRIVIIGPVRFCVEFHRPPQTGS